MNHSSNSRNEAFEIKINHERVNHQNESFEEIGTFYTLQR